MQAASGSAIERLCEGNINAVSLTTTYHYRRQAFRGSARLNMQRQSQRSHRAQQASWRRKAPPGDALYSDGIVGHRSCDRIAFDPSAAALSNRSPRVRRDEVSLAFRRQHDAVDVLRLAAEVVRRTDVEALIRGACLHHLVGQDGDPGTIDFDFIVVTHRAARGRAAVGKIAA